jgi:hypothetical protein
MVAIAATAARRCRIEWDAMSLPGNQWVGVGRANRGTLDGPSGLHAFVTALARYVPRSLQPRQGRASSPRVALRTSRTSAPCRRATDAVGRLARQER